MTFVHVLLAVAVLCSTTSTANQLPPIPTFLKGFSSAPSSLHGIELVANTSANVVRRYLSWSMVEPELGALNFSLSVAVLKAHPEDIYTWSEKVDWGSIDGQVQSLKDFNAGKDEDDKVRAILQCGEGTLRGVPKFNGTRADPNVIGIDLYLAYQYRFCRAAAHRYGTGGGSTNFTDAISPIWQIENELNEAFLAGFQHQRMVSLVWANWTFLTELLETLKSSVVDEVPGALVTMNFHTDIPKCIHTSLALPGYYEWAVMNWSHIFPILSFDAYPCMFTADPTWGAMVGQRLVNIRTAAEEAEGRGGPTKPIFVMETGYPVNAPHNKPNLTKDPLFNFTTANQAQYVDSVWESLHLGNHRSSTRFPAGGLLYFEWTISPGMSAPPHGGYSREDNSMFSTVKKFLDTGKESVLLDWLLDGHDGFANFKELAHRASMFLSAPHWGWGLEDEDHQMRPAFNQLVKNFRAIP